jgi:hypothetical protein
MRKITSVLSLLLLTAAVYGQDAVVSDRGEQLKKAYLAMDVEHLWQSGAHVDWQTGQPDDPTATHGVKTHCSAFVAAACERLGIYILRPPQHRQELLANAQYDWLASPEAVEKGWHRLSGRDIYYRAQDYANKGYVVAVTYKNTDAHEPGHIALVMPARITAEELAADGPKVIMASTHNYNFISVHNGFKHHITTWPEPAILFYYNENKVK